MASLDELEMNFDRHDAYSRFLTATGTRVSSGNTPSIYITIVKFKKALKKLDFDDLSKLTGNELKTEEALNFHKTMLLEKLEKIHSEHLFIALELLIKGDNLKAFQLIFNAKTEDEILEEQEYEKTNTPENKKMTGVFITIYDLMQLYNYGFQHAKNELATIRACYKKHFVTIKEFCAIEDLDYKKTLIKLRPNLSDIF